MNALLRRDPYRPGPALPLLLAGLLTAAIGVLVAGVLLGRLTAPDSPTTRGDQQQEGAAGPADSGDLTAFPRTKDGALAAAANIVARIGDVDVVTDPERRAAVAEHLLAADAPDDVLPPLLTPETDQGGILAGVEAGEEVSGAATPLAGRVDGFSEDAATVQMWTVSTVATPELPEPVASWTTANVGLVWQDEEWRLSSLRGTPGPTPATAGDPSTFDALTQAIAGMEGFRYVPAP